MIQWGVRYETSTWGQLPAKGVEVVTVEAELPSEQLARNWHENSYPANGIDHRLICREVGDWQEL